jgi:hypothetical protein
MFNHEIQLLSRRDGDYHFHRNTVLGVGVPGKVGFRSYYFAGRKCLVVLLESRPDVDAVLKVLPRYAAVSVREIAVQPQSTQTNAVSAA